MEVQYAGWSKKYGSFDCSIFVDENKEDHEIRFSNGHVLRQSSPFQMVTADWNHDGDVYTQFGAWFRDSDTGRSEFWAVVSLVRAAADLVREDYAPYGNHIVAVSGINVPLPKDRPPLEKRLRETEARALARDIERNRTMNFLGIRRPGEPWAR